MSQSNLSCDTVYIVYVSSPATHAQLERFLFICRNALGPCPDRAKLASSAIPAQKGKNTLYMSLSHSLTLSAPQACCSRRSHAPHASRVLARAPAPLSPGSRPPKNESGQPGDEKSVGYPLGDVIASISRISAGVSCQLKARADARSPSAHALLLASHALRPGSGVGAGLGVGAGAGGRGRGKVG